MTHEEVQQLLGAVAVDAVDPEEAALVEAHVRECARCRAELDELRETAALLGNGGGEAPAGLWDRIGGALTESPPPLRLEVRRARRARRLPLLRVGAAVAAAVTIIALSVAMLDLRDEVRDVRRAQSSSQAGEQIALAAEQALGAADTRVARLTGTAGWAALAVVGADGQAYLLAGSLPPLDDRIYEIWGATSTGEVTALGTIPGPGIYAFTATASIERVLLTAEDEPVPAPTSAPLAAGALA